MAGITTSEGILLNPETQRLFQIMTEVNEVLAYQKDLLKRAARMIRIEVNGDAESWHWHDTVIATVEEIEKYLTTGMRPV